MKYLISIIALLLFAETGFCQENYKPAYYVTNSNDTVRGFINFRSDKMNAREYQFKQDEAAKAQVFYPGDIKLYRFTDDGLYYISKEIDMNGEKRKLFLQYLVNGVMDLYYFVDTDDLKYFVFDEAGNMTVITKKSSRNENGVLIPDNKYVGILNYTFRNNESAVKDIHKLRFLQNDMINITKKYHDEVCTSGEDCIVYTDKNADKNYLKIKLTPYVGIAFFEYEIASRIMTSTASNTSPLVGMQAAFFAPRVSNSFSVLLDVSVAQIKDDIITKTAYAYNETMDISSLVGFGRVGLNYKYQKWKVQPSVEGGLSLAYIFSNKSERYWISPTSPENNTKLEDYDMRKRFLGYYLSAGVNYKIQKDSYITLRYVFDGYSMGDGTQMNGDDKFRSSSIKIGYTF